MASTASAANRARTRLLTSWSTPGELARVIMILALPVALTNSLQMLLGFVDTRMVSPLGEDALSAMAIGRQSSMLLMALFMGLGVGITAYVARLMGAGQRARARDYATVGVLTGTALALILGLLGLLFAKPLVVALATGQGGGVAAADSALAQRYAWDIMRLFFISLAAIGTQVAAISVFNSLGRTMYPMWLLVLANIANLAGNIILIPRYEVAGSAGSTAIMFGIGATVAVFTLTRIGALRWNAQQLLHPLRKSWDMLKVGLPVTLQLTLRSLSMLAIIKLITMLPNHVVGQGAFLVGLQVESIAFMPAFAFSTAAATLVGQNLGAQRTEQARISALYCLLGSQIVMWGIGALLFYLPGWFVHLFIGNNAPEIVEPAVGFLRVLALCLPGLGLGQTMMGVLRGSGDTFSTVWISVLAMYAVRLPLACFLALDFQLGSLHSWNLGLNGIWWAMTISVYVESMLAYARFASGKWAKIKLG